MSSALPQLLRFTSEIISGATRPSSNRRPTRSEVEAARPFLEELAVGRRVLAVGRLAAEVTSAAYVRHPSHGGAAEFRAGLLRFAAGGRF
jgi:uracil-DNA glycosylase